MASSAAVPPPEMTKGVIVLEDGDEDNGCGTLVCVGCWGLFFFCVCFLFVISENYTHLKYHGGGGSKDPETFIRGELFLSE